MLLLSQGLLVSMRDLLDRTGWDVRVTATDELPRRVVEIVYTDVDPVLWGAAELSVRAQLAYLQSR